MATAVSSLDVAAYILSKKGQMTAMKLQKLVYYCQAWHLVWEEEPLFPEQIQAWPNGPVVPKLYAYHRGAFKVGRIGQGSTEKLSDTQKETIDIVLKYYGDKSTLWLVELTHSEKPWLDARKGLRPDEPSQNRISQAAMAEYYASL